MSADELDRELLKALGTWVQTGGGAQGSEATGSRAASGEAASGGTASGEAAGGEAARRVLGGSLAASEMGNTSIQQLVTAATRQDSSGQGSGGTLPEAAAQIAPVLETPVVAISSAAAGSQGGGTPGQGQTSTDLAERLSQLTTELEQLRQTGQSQTEAITANTNALASGGASVQKQDSSSVLGTIGKVLEGTLGTGLGLVPLISGLIGLFGGGGQSEPAPLDRYVAPAAIQIQAGFSGADRTVQPIDYGEGGGARTISSTSYAPQITVNVSAMDSRSFADHSDEIAQAVRDAMLNSHPINDVVSEL